MYDINEEIRKLQVNINSTKIDILNHNDLLRMYIDEIEANKNRIESKYFDPKKSTESHKKNINITVGEINKLKPIKEALCEAGIDAKII